MLIVRSFKAPATIVAALVIGTIGKLAEASVVEGNHPLFKACHYTHTEVPTVGEPGVAYPDARELFARGSEREHEDMLPDTLSEVAYATFTHHGGDRLIHEHQFVESRVGEALAENQGARNTAPEPTSAALAALALFGLATLRSRKAPPPTS